MKVISRGKARFLLMKNYLILDKIGKGASGTVFRAVHLSMQREVALKVLSTKHINNSKASQRFFREIRAAGQLQHPNIVTAYDSNKAHGHWFLVSEFVSGVNLDEYVTENGPVSIEFALDTILKAARGLMFAHESGVIHRDIKPSNLIRTELGEVKILDLGLVLWNSADDLDYQDQVKLTRSGIITGTPAYMAPEQADNANCADGRSDIYSLGCTLYYFLTGRLIHDEDSVMRMLLAHQREPNPVLMDEVDGVSAHLQDVFEKMVAKDPDDRYQRVSQLIADLESLKNHSRPWNVAESKHEISEEELLEFVGNLSSVSSSPHDGPNKDFYLDDSEANISTASMLAKSLSTISSVPPEPEHTREHFSAVHSIKNTNRRNLLFGAACLLIVILLIWVSVSF
ncbi:MAG: serine/threonine protein kinase [Planctomycetaceae bacterium]|nr:serine/threonine protein kinase [Planctomycetaceae bacterium]